MGQSNQKYLEKQLFDLRFTSKQLLRQSKKAEKNEGVQKKKLKTAIEKGDMEVARIYAQNAIRSKAEAVNFLRLSSRIDAVAQRVQTAVSMGQLTKTMTGVVKGMDRALATMDVEKISKVMDQFEEQFEDLDVRAAYMEGAMDQTTATTTPEQDVNTLIQMVADEHGLQLAADLDDAGLVSSKPVENEAAVEAPESDLAARLAALNSGD